MSAILYVAAFVAMAIIIFWYVQDEATRGGKGNSGFLGMQDRLGDRRPKSKAHETPKAGRQSWRSH